ncbi:MAG: Tfp pilus assembly protein FimT/FimU [Bulleidia sp.]
MAARQSRSRTAGRSAASGFALAELLVSILIIAVLLRMAGSLHAFQSGERLSFADQYLRCQSEALLKGAYVTFTDEEGNTRPEIRFNGQGNINRARTIAFPDSRDELVIELGTGRLAEH